MAPTRSTPPKNATAKDYQQLWKSVTGATDAVGAVRALAKIVVDSDGRAFVSELETKDAVLCIEALDYGITELNLGTADKNNFFLTLRRLTEHHGRLPDRMMMTGKIQVSGNIVASGGFGDVRTGIYMGHIVAVKTARVTELSNLKQIKKQFYKEVLLWEPLSHPNILKLIGVRADTKKGLFVTVSEWMERGNIMEFIANRRTNRLELLHQATQGLDYLHSLNLTHGDLKGANILMSNDTPPRACLADFGFTTTVLDPDQQISCSAQLEGGTTMFLAPELLMPEVFDKGNSVPTLETDIYAFAFVIYQVLAGDLPFNRNRAMTFAGFVVFRGVRPEKPKDASTIGFSDSLWRFTQRCWDGDMKLRPKVGELVKHLGEAAVKWGKPMPPHVPAKDAASNPREAWSDSLQHAGIFHSASTDVSESSAESKSTSGTSASGGFNLSSSPPTLRTGSSREESQKVVSRLVKEMRLDTQVPARPSEEPDDDPTESQTPDPEPGAPKFLELLRLRN